MADQVLDLRAGLRAQIKRHGVGQQLVEQHAEAIDIRGGSHRVAEHLFRAGVFRSHHPRFFASDGGLVDGIHELGDTEIEELRRAVSRHQHVRGFDIAVDDELAVRVLHRVAKRQDQADAIIDRELVRTGEIDNRRAVNVLHDKIGRAGFGAAAVQQSRDVRVVEIGENLAFLDETLDLFGCRTQPVNHLDGYLLLELVVRSFGEVDLAHTALADDFQQAIRTDPLIAHRGLAPVLLGTLNDTVDLVAGDGTGRDELHHLSFKLLIAAALPAHEDLSLVTKAVHGLPVNRLDALPAVRIHQRSSVSRQFIR